MSGRMLKLSITIVSLGIGKTQSQVTQQYYWNDVTTDVREYVNSCLVCQLTKDSKLEKGRPKLHSIPIAPRIWDFVGIDILCLPTTKDNYRYLVSAICYFR